MLCKRDDYDDDDYCHWGENKVDAAEAKNGIGWWKIGHQAAV